MDLSQPASSPQVLTGWLAHMFARWNRAFLLKITFLADLTAARCMIGRRGEYKSVSDRRNADPGKQDADCNSDDSEENHGRRKTRRCQADG